jgi:transposase
MAQITSFVGLDVHANQTHAGVLDQRPANSFAVGSRATPLTSPLPRAPRSRARAVYEAGPTGFALARAAAERGLEVRVCAPGLIPRKPADRVKTDPRDAEPLASVSAKGFPTGAPGPLRWSRVRSWWPSAPPRPPRRRS